MAKVIDISEYKVMQSPAGFYVGRSCLTAYEDGEIVPEPYDRASDYFNTHEEAASYLRYICPDEPEYDVTEQQEWEDYDPYC